MRTTARTWALLLLVIALGCGTKESSSPPPVNQPLGIEANPIGGPKKDEDPNAKKPPEPQEPPAVWEMDASKHKIPGRPAEGKLAGSDFKTTSVRLKGSALTLMMTDNRSFALEFQLPPGQKLEHRKIVVRAEEEPAPNVPEVSVKSPALNGGMELKYVNGFAMTLELGPRDSGKVPGRIYLCMPGEEKSFIAGEFTADWERLDTDPPGPEQAPYVQGKIAVAGVPNTVIKAGYIGKPRDATLFVSDSQDLSLEGPNAVLFTRSNQSPPRMTTVHAGTKDSPSRYEHVKLPPGRYFVYSAAHKESPTPPTEVWATGKWVSVGDKAEVTADFAIDAAAVGTIEFRAPVGTGKVTVMLVPAAEEGVMIDDGLFQGAALSLGLAVEAKDGKAAFTRIIQGRYEVRAYEQPTPNDPMRPIGTPKMLKTVVGSNGTVDLNEKK